MPFLAALVLLGAHAPIQTAAPASGFSLFGSTVTAEAPPKGAADYPDEIAKWSGWGNLSANGAIAAKPFLTDGDWSAALVRPKPAGSAGSWRVKVFILDSVDLLARDGYGNLVERRSGIAPPVRARIAQGLALAGATLEAESGGYLNVSFDTSEDLALYRQTLEGPALGALALQDYVTPRINGGSFEANDKLYHGPFDACLVIHPGFTDPAATEASNTPVFGIPAFLHDDSISSYAQEFLKVFESSVSYWAEKRGRAASKVVFDSLALENIFGDVPAEQLPDLTTLGPVSGDQIVKNAKAGPIRSAAFSQTAVLVPSVKSSNVTLAVTADSTFGSILSAKVNGAFPAGGFAIPTPAHRSDSEFLVFSVRTTTPDVLGIGAVVDGARSPNGVTLGIRADAGPELSVPPDGKWYKVAISLKQVLPAGSNGIFIGFLGEVSRNPKLSIVATAYDFANFSLQPTAPADALAVADSTSPDWSLRASAARAAAKTSESPQSAAAITSALTDSSDLVKLNACDVLSRVKLPGLEDKLAAAVGNMNPPLTDMALAALSNQDTPAAVAILRQMVQSGPGTHAKAIAARYLSLHKGAGGIGAISALEGTARDWHDRLDALNALIQSGGPEAGLFVRSFLEDPDPQVRMVTATNLDPTDNDGMHRLLFLSVNDPSDAVRVAACIKLLQSASADIKHEGYRGTNDDSWPVRVQVLDWIAAHPTADDRPALRQAIVSPYGPVRAATLRALASSQGPVVIDEIANVLKDADPQVQRELIAVVKAKQLALPADSIAALKASIAPDVATAAAAMP